MLLIFNALMIFEVVTGTYEDLQLNIFVVRGNELESCLKGLYYLDPFPKMGLTATATHCYIAGGCDSVSGHAVDGLQKRSLSEMMRGVERKTKLQRPRISP